MTPFDKYLHAIIEEATHQAHQEGSATIEAQHLLLAIATERETTTRQALTAAGLDHQTIREALDREFEHSLNAAGVSRAAFNLPRASPSLDRPKIGASAKLALERGFSSAARKKDLRPAHILLGILQAQAGTVPRALALADVNQADLVTRVQQTLTTTRAV